MNPVPADRSSGRPGAGRFLFAAALALLASAANADPLDWLLGGSWGSPERDDLRCLDNAKTPELIGGDLIRFHYRTGIEFPPGTWTQTLDYRIVERGPDWMKLRIPNEFREFDGRSITWIMAFESPGRFCWKIDGDGSGLCDNPQVRCAAPPPIS
jgi:hypothetical protein